MDLAGEETRPRDRAMIRMVDTRPNRPENQRPEGSHES
jgi:hypothetical protein